MLRHFFRYLYIKFKTRGKKISFSYSSIVAVNTFFEGYNAIGNNTMFQGYIGMGSYIGPNSNIHGRIGRFSSIASNVLTPVGTHPFRSPFVSTSPSFFSRQGQNHLVLTMNNSFEETLYAEPNYPIVIENDCWICQGSIISNGVKISNGTVVLPGAVVTKTTQPYSIVGGVPAKTIGYRYDQETIKELLKIKWWEQDLEWIKSNASLFNNISEFILKFKV